MIVDAHQHFWKVERGDYHWMTPAVPALYRDFMPSDLEPLLRRTGVSRTILVQAAETEAETDFLLEIAAETEFVAGVVGWLDFDAPDFPKKLERLSAMPKLVGLRPMLQDLADDAWIRRPRVVEHLRLVADRGLPFEFLTYPRHLPHVVAALERAPGLRAAIDHLSKPPIAAGRLDPWRELISAAAGFPNVCCKLSGMVTEADPANWRLEDLRPFADHVLSTFGPERVMVGSDWPVCLLAASYAEVLNAARTIVAAWVDPQQAAAVFGGNAVRFYRLEN